MITKHIRWLQMIAASIVLCSAAHAQDGTFYWCHKNILVAGNPTNYVTRVLPAGDPTKTFHPFNAVGKAFVGYLLKKYSPDNRQDVLNTESAWGLACEATAPPWGPESIKASHDRAVDAGAVEIDWQYTPDQNTAAAPTSIPPECRHKSNQAQVDQCLQLLHRADSPTTTTHNPASNSSGNAVAPAPQLPAPAAPKPMGRMAALNATRQTPAAPVAATPSTVYVICYADSDPHAKYYNPPVDGAGGNYTVWTAGYQKFLVQKYRFSGWGVRCNDEPTLAAAQAYYRTTIDAERAALTANGNPLPVVVTDWKN
jgi:hypothetical protein